jgi:hypothetical protein
MTLTAKAAKRLRLDFGIALAVPKAHHANAGHARAAALTPERRRDIAQAAARARWARPRA